MLPEFTFEGFTQTKDAINWFESVSEVAGTLETKPGFYSVHDTMAAIRENEQAKKAVLSCMTAIMERALPEQMLFMGDMEKSVADTLSEGFIGEILGDKKETTLRKLHAALTQIPKE